MGPVPQRRATAPRDDGYYVRVAIRALRDAGMKDEAIFALIKAICRERDELLRKSPPTPTHPADQ